jgi:hypothetical protein
MQDLVRIPGEFAIVAMDVEFPIDVLNPDGALFRKAMLGMDNDHHLLAKQRQAMNAAVHLPGKRVDRDFELAAEQACAQVLGT